MTSEDPQQIAHSEATALRAAKALYEGDRASQSLGMVILQAGPGTARVRMQVRDDMVNGHGACHGGLIFSLADSAFAFACNSYGAPTVGAAASIDYLRPAMRGDELIADARELWLSRRSGIYEVTINNQRGETVALFRGRSHRVAQRADNA